MKKSVLGLILLMCLTAGLYFTLYGSGTGSGVPRFPLAKWVGGFPHGSYVFDAAGVLRLAVVLLVYAVLAAVIGRAVLLPRTLPLLRLSVAVLAVSLCYSLVVNSPFFAALLPGRQANAAGHFFRKYLWFLLDEQHGPVIVVKYLPQIAVIHTLVTYGTILLAGRLGRGGRQPADLPLRVQRAGQDDQGQGPTGT